MTPALAALFKLRPDRGADYLLAKGLQLTGPYWELDGPAHSRVFTVAHLAKLDVLTDLKTAVQQAIDAGQTEKWFQDQLVAVLQRKGWWGKAVTVDPDTLEARVIQQGSLRRLQTIYRTNLQSAYMAGRHRQALEQADRAPFAQYLAVRDARTRPGHAALHGQVFRLDSPAWAVIAPPNGYNCRCRARYLSARELAARGLKPAEDVRVLERPPPGNPPVDPLTGETPARWVQRGVSVPDPLKPGERLTLWADPNWDHLPGSDGAERALVDKLLATASQLSDGIKEALISDAPAALAGVMVKALVASDDFSAWYAAPMDKAPQPVGVIPASDAASISAETRVVMLSADTAIKQQARHADLSPADYAFVQAGIDRGERIQDGAQSMIYLLEEEGFVTVVKATGSGKGLWLTSFRRLPSATAKRDSEVRRLRKKGQVNDRASHPAETGNPA